MELKVTASTYTAQAPMLRLYIKWHVVAEPDSHSRKKGACALCFSVPTIQEKPSSHTPVPLRAASAGHHLVTLPGKTVLSLLTQTDQKNVC